MSATASRTSHAETISCWAREYAAALLLLVVPPSTATLNAWLTPAPPGVTDTPLEIEFEALTATTEWKLTGIE